MALTDGERTLAVDGRGHQHPVDPYAHGSVALAGGHLVILGADEMKVGQVKITVVKGPRLSICSAVSGSGFKAGDILKP